MKFSNNVISKKHAPKLIFFNEKKLRKIWIIFDIKNWLWKSEIGIFWSLDLEQMLIWQIFFLWKSDSIKLPLDAQFDKKILNVTYLMYMQLHTFFDTTNWHSGRLSYENMIVRQSRILIRIRWLWKFSRIHQFFWQNSDQRIDEFCSQNKSDKR